MPSFAPAAAAAANGVAPGAAGGAAAAGVDALKLQAVQKISQIKSSSPEVEAALREFLQKLTTVTPREVPVVTADESLERLRAALKLRGTHGIITLGKKFRSMDDCGNGQLSFEEFRKAMAEMSLPEPDVHRLFRAFDADCSGSLTFDEFLVGLRGALSERRLAMVQAAYQVLDKTGDGQVAMADIEGRYDASKHPDVILGNKKPQEVLLEFMSSFEGAAAGGAKGDGVITFDEFKAYYAGVSASVDDDDYFELLIRNAWHISGGEGWCANTTCKRVLVLHEDGSQSVQEISNDFDVRPEQYLAKLKEQGVTGIKSIAMYGSPDDVPSGKPPAIAAGSVPSSPAPRTPGPLSPSAGGGLRSPATDGPDTAASRYAGNKRAAQSSSIQFG